MENSNKVSDLNTEAVSLVKTEGGESVKQPGFVDVDQPLVHRDWLLVVKENPNTGTKHATLHESNSGVPGRKITHLDLEFDRANYIFAANVRIVEAASFTFKEHNPVNLTGSALAVTLISLSAAKTELCICFKGLVEEDAELTFNIVDHGGTVLVSEDPSVAIRKKNG